MKKRWNVADIQEKAAKGEKLVMITAYDATSARLADESGVDMILVGDSLGWVSLGYESAVSVTLEEVIAHTRAVVRGSKQAMVVADLPYGSYESGEEQAVKNAIRLIKEGGAGAVKVEGGREIVPLVSRMSKMGIPVVCHMGYMPQTSWLWQESYTLGRDEESAWELVDTAQELEEAGAIALFLQCVAAEAAELIGKKVDVPCIGMGSGNQVDGQAQLFFDVVGISDDIPMHARKFAQGGDILRSAIRDYGKAVRSGVFPDEDHMEMMEEDEAKRLD